MIPNHAQFLAAIQQKRKVWIKFYSPADNGVLERACAPMNYGPGENKDGLNRYWLWDFASGPSAHTLGLTPQQIVELTVLGEGFDPSQFVIEPLLPPTGSLPPPVVAVTGGDTSPVV